MTDWFEVMKGITRAHQSTLENYPPLHADEHRWIEEKLGRKLTNAQAQEALRDATLLAAFGMWSAGKRQME
jgi:uncharacterized protein YneF (UPF0154 family)